MKKLSLFVAAALGAFGIPALAQAAPAYSTADVNMRSGPSTQYPPVLVIPYGSRVDIRGCLSSQAWCDVDYRGIRGWVSGSYLQASYEQRRVYVGPSYYEPLGIPTVMFSIDSYWDRHYRDRDFYRQRDEWRDGYYRPTVRRDDYRRPPPPRWNDDEDEDYGWREPPRRVREQRRDPPPPPFVRDEERARAVYERHKKNKRSDGEQRVIRCNWGMLACQSHD
ncbi:SH3 domain-containing protein [Ciceribacter ferrooxidans]|uniref:SH3 domain-containing protein n=1 Tax=Ciceribacter ferrooxidans TaxID=2509717 RepID=A0A4Q2SGA2_9HYPH|nr:SH3 domain-containing protein [Ciceribacter ferrooxidans]RYC04485.1 SH3 domain-containing protein [Ciceribacter ferrooxidans]